MYRRLFYMFPDKESVIRVVNELRQKKIPTSQMHTIAQPGKDMSDLPEATTWQKEDMHSKVENIVWNLNLLLFITMFIIFVYALNFQATGWAILAAVVMFACVFAGYQFIHIPSLKLSEFKSAFRHGEILLMVDLPQNQLKPIDDFIQHSHAEAVEGGVCWIPSDSKM